MQTDKQELLQSQMNVKETPTDKENSGNNKLIEKEKIEKTPFYIIGDKENGYFLAFGKFQLTERQPSKLDVIIYLEQNKWDIALKLVLSVSELMENEKEYDELTEDRLQ